jgi:threonine aldolase
MPRRIFLPMIDLRSDTVTLPSPEMRKAMYEAELGDDVFHEDPTVNRLEEMAAEMMGKEAALLTSSGTQSNLIAILSHCSRATEVIMGSEAHTFHHEAGGAAAFAGVQLRLVPNRERGTIDPEDVRAAIRRPNVHHPPTSLFCLENTHNRCGGGVLTPEEMAAPASVAHEHNIPVHVDGARIFNAAVYLSIPASELVKDVDDVCFCLSKGLSCPVGSVLCGSRDFIQSAHRWRKALGGGMRQAGVIAAAGIVALESMVERLAEDHENARLLARGLAEVPGIHIDPAKIQTNIVYFKLDGDVAAFLDALKERGVLALSPESPGAIRMVTHYGINREDVEEALSIIARVAREKVDSRKR